jgi:geranylgeranyl diphosphate synthase, type I
MDELNLYKDKIKTEINKILSHEIVITKEEDKLIYEILKEYTLRGKLIRGSLILMINELFNNEISNDALTVSVVLEILHSSILIIDDIIDKDDLRRGKNSIHIITKDLIPNSIDLEHDAKSIAQCIALIGTYFSYKHLSNIENKVIFNLSNEFIKTGFAELNEIILAQQKIVSKEDVLNIYKFKTARYTITLPFKLGFILSDKEFTFELEEITDNIGIIFQMKDDLLELESTTTNIGKSDLSDIKAGKQHFPRKLLEQFANDNDLDLIKECYSKLDNQSVLTLKNLYEKYNVVEENKKIINDLKQKTILLIDKQEDKIKKMFYNVLNFIINRSY